LTTSDRDQIIWGNGAVDLRRFRTVTLAAGAALPVEPVRLLGVSAHRLGDHLRCYYSVREPGERYIVTKLSMYSKSQFCDLEAMCHERAAAARKEGDYWLAEEWARFRLSCNLQQVDSSEPSQSTKLNG
jgi:hypothetical protein